MSGNHADDPLYIPAIDQVLKIIDGIGFLFVGDCKMSALAIRAHIQRLNHHYLCPLAMTGSTASEIVQWIEGAQNGGHALQSVYVESAQGERKLLAEGYAFERTVKDQVAGGVHEWLEQVFMVRSESYRHVLQEHLEERLQRAAVQVRALTPAPGRGKRQIRDENALVSAVAAILKQRQVEDLLTYTFERQEQRQTKYVGRGRGSPDRRQKEIVTVR